MPYRLQRRRITLMVYAIPLTVATAFYLPGLFFRQWMWDAGLYAAVSLRMARTGEWWTPMQANATYFNKPPLAFWLHALFVRIFGEADWVLRLPCLLSALACVALITSIAKRLHGPRVGLLAGLLLALTAEFVWRISRFRLDFLHTALMLAALRMAIEGVLSRRSRSAHAAGSDDSREVRSACWIVLSGIPVGLAMLVKPMFGLIVLLIAGAWMVLSGPPVRRRARWAPVAALVALAVAAPWHVSMYAIHGRAFVDRFFVHESIARATGARFAPEPWWWYLRYLITGKSSEAAAAFSLHAAWYWPILLCAAMAVVWWARGRRLGRRTSPRGGLLAQVYTLGLLVALGLFGDKKPWYLIPALPGIAWIGAMWVTTVAPRAAPRWVVRAGLPVAVLGVAAVLITGVRFEVGNPRPANTRPLQAFILEHPEGDYWNGSVFRYDSSPIYIRTGVWPKFIRDPNTGREWEPPRGSYILYDKRRPPAPDPADPVVAEAPNFVIVRREGDGPLPREGLEQ